MIIGNGVPDTEFDGCTVRWAFCGQEFYRDPMDPCSVAGWQVRISGMTICPCPPAS